MNTLTTSLDARARFEQALNDIWSDDLLLSACAYFASPQQIEQVKKSIASLSGSKDRKDRTAVARLNRLLMARVMLASLVSDVEPDVEDLSPEVLACLAEELKWRVRAEVSEHPNTSPEVLAYLAEDKDVMVRSFTAGNLNTSPEVMEMLVGDASPQVRVVAVENPNTPVEAIEGCLNTEQDAEVMEMLMAREDFVLRAIEVLVADGVSRDELELSLDAEVVERFLEWKASKQ